MCGLVAIYGYGADAAHPDEAELLRIRDAMAARGPDAAGAWASPDGRLRLGHRRLSIIDLHTAANQPMVDPTRQLCIVFNGEIYNHAQLRAELSADYAFQTQSDTEVILAAYAADPQGFVTRLRGMFAFVLWDGARGELVAGRDPYGIKPLYLADDGRTLRLASQVKALLAGGGVASVIDPEAAYGYLCWGSVPGPRTMHRAIRSLPPGHLLRVTREGQVRQSCFAEVGQVFLEAPATMPTDPQAAIADALEDTTTHHLVADVPVGVFLSAGIDSTLLATLFAEHAKTPPVAVTLGFREFAGTERDETRLAAEVARELGLDHHVYWLDRDEFLADLDAALSAMDQPSIDGINTYFVSKAARAAGLKTVLSGLGGDELFGGYPSFADLPRWQALRRRLPTIPGVPALAKTAIEAARRAPALRRRIPAKLAGVLEVGASVGELYALRRGLFLPREARAIAHALLGRGPSDAAAPMGLQAWQPAPDADADYRNIAALESTLYMRNQLLRDSDWASMAHSLELRVPLVDYTLLQRLLPVLAGLPAVHKGYLRGKKRYDFQRAIYDRKKTGFHTPVDRWILEAGIMDVRDSEGRPSRDWAKYVLRRYLDAR